MNPGSAVLCCYELDLCETPFLHLGGGTNGTHYLSDVVSQRASGNAYDLSVHMLRCSVRAKR